MTLMLRCGARMTGGSFPAAKVRGGFIEAIVMGRKCWRIRCFCALLRGQVLHRVADELGQVTRGADHRTLGLDDLGNALSSPSDRLSVNNCRHSTGLTLNRTEAY